MIDAHCHLNDEKFGNEVDSEIKKAHDVGINSIICDGFDFNSSKRAIYLADKYDSIWATVGLGYNHNYFDLAELKPKLLELISHPKVVAIGECGLDKWESISPKVWQSQLELFDFHIQLAKETGLPLVVHCRNAFEEVFDRIGSHPYSPPARSGNDPLIQMHCFTGSWEWAEKFLDKGCYLSFGGVTTFKSSDYLREVVKQTPSDKLLMETDSPYIAPEPVRNQRNSPANLIHIAKLVANLRNLSVAEVDQITSTNASRLFPKMKLPNLT